MGPGRSWDGKSKTVCVVVSAWNGLAQARLLPGGVGWGSIAL
jgi:hypothetical protein